MYIHNFYADLLLSLRVLFDKYIFQNDKFIKRYEFNIGNRTFQLPKNFKPQFEFPNVIASINDEIPAFGQRPAVVQSIPEYNIDQVPVLYNKTNENVLYVQEELVTVPILAVINCESQLQAKEISNVVRRWLPYNKYIQFLEYTSFLEVSKPFISEVGFDMNNDDIINLYTKLNTRTGQIDYCFAIHYRPFIRLDSISTTIGDSTQRSFQVNIDLTYIIQFPLYLFSSLAPGRIDRIDISFNSNKFEPISDYPSAKLINNLLENSSDLRKGIIRRQYLIYDDDSSEDITALDDVVLFHNQVKAESSRLKVERVTDSIYIIVDNNESRRYKVSTLIPIEGVRITLDNNKDQYLFITSDDENNINIGLRQQGRVLIIKCHKSDFVFEDRYSYNLINNNFILKNYTSYIINMEENYIIFTFTDSDWNKLKPSLTQPLIIQIYDPISENPHQYGGTMSKLSNIKVSYKSQTAAVITWVSHIETNTRIEYGLTPNYGFFSDVDNKMTNIHKMVLRSLEPFTNYHFRVNTIDVNGQPVISEDYTFTTSP